METRGQVGRGLHHNQEQPDLTPMPARPANHTPKPSTAPASWGARPPQRESGDRPIVGANAFGKNNRNKRGGRAAFQ